MKKDQEEKSNLKITHLNEKRSESETSEFKPLTYNSEKDVEKISTPLLSIEEVSQVVATLNILRATQSNSMIHKTEKEFDLLQRFIWCYENLEHHYATTIGLTVKGENNTPDWKIEDSLNLYKIDQIKEKVSVGKCFKAYIPQEKAFLLIKVLELKESEIPMTIVCDDIFIKTDVGIIQHNSQVERPSNAFLIPVGLYEITSEEFEEKLNLIKILQKN